MSPLSSFKPRLHAESKRLRAVHRRNISVLRAQPWRELSGAFGDIGTFIPIFVALSRPDFRSGTSHTSAPAISPAATLLLSGLANLVTGIFFGLPLPVQPMKAIAAVAIAAPTAYDAESVASAGLFVGGVIGILSAVGAVRFLVDTIPLPVVRGIQVAAGLSLASKGFAQLLGNTHGDYGQTDLEEIVRYVSTSLALALLGWATLRPHVPYVLVIVLGSVAFGVAWIVYDAVVGNGHPPAFAIWQPQILVPDAGVFFDGAVGLGLGQIPLTALNSIVAVVFLAESLFVSDSVQPRSEGEAEDSPSEDAQVGKLSATSVGLSVSLMNLVGCWFFAMPVCHGSGGLAAQYAFGARSGASVAILGGLKVALGLVGSESVLRWSAAFPTRVLGILLALAGMELVKMGESINDEASLDLRGQQLDAETRMRRYVVMMATVATSLGVRNAGVGFLLGMVVHFAYRLKDKEQERLANAEGRIRLEPED